MDENQIAELANLPIAELAERLGELDAAGLTALRAAEVTANDGGRKGALAAIDAAAKLSEVGAAGSADGQAAEGELEQSGVVTPAAPPVEQKPASKGAAKSKDKAEPADAASSPAPAWQDENYDGPLTIPQGEWRRHNIKPVQQVRTK